MALCIPDDNRHQYLIHLDFNLEGDNFGFLGLLRYQVQHAQYEGQAQDNKQNGLHVYSHTDTMILRSPVLTQQYQANKRAIAGLMRGTVGDKSSLHSKPQFSG
ncbi:MAG: hypothetical protein WA637_08085 [Terriglobales bacterium]